MTYFRQILEKRRWLLGLSSILFLIAAFYFGFNLAQGENFAALKAGFSSLQTADFDGFSPTAVFFLLIGATLFSEDLACIAAGVLASQGRIELFPAIVACAVGIFIGDTLTFLAGRVLGRRALKWKITSYFLSEEAVEKSSRWMARQGMKTVFTSRFVFGTRLPLYFGAGVLKTSFWRFALYFSLAVAVWTPVVVILTYKIGAEAVKMSLFNQNLWLGLLLLVVVFYIFFRFLQQLFTWKGRRILWGKIKRRFRWEFWSRRVFYTPVAIYVGFLALKHRSLTVFTCANPGILASGFVGESKDEILSELDNIEAARPFLLKHLFLSEDLSPEAKLQTASDFMTENHLSFPIVVKPNGGSRGSGVQITKSFTELNENLTVDENLIVQEFAGGEETSVFYCRYPAQVKGRILAIALKRFPVVKGNGEATLEELILRDERAIFLAEKYLEQNAERLETIPEIGETVQITEIGTHSRGAIYLDGEQLRTDALENKINEICCGFEGFYFGKFDIRVKTLEEFRAAEKLKIIELNGVTSRPTNIFDPKFSLLEAYQKIFRQWKTAFEIGAENRRRGAQPTRISDLIKLLRGKPIQNPKSEIQNPRCV